MTAKLLSIHACKRWLLLFSLVIGSSLQVSCQKSSSSSTGAGSGGGGKTTAEEEVDFEVSGTIDPTDFAQAQDSVEISGVNLTTTGKYAISAFYISPLGKKVSIYLGTADGNGFSFKSKVPKRYLTIDVTRPSDGYRLGAFLPPALRNKLAKLRLNRTSSIAATMANIIADKAAAGDEAALKALSTNSISVADTLVVAQSVARVITEQENQNKGSSIDLAALTAKLIEKSNDKIAALQGEGQSVAVVAEKISEKTYETVFSGDAEATSPGVLAYRTNHDLGTSTIAKRDVAYEAIKDLSGDSTKYVDAAFRVEANAFRNASGLSDAVAAENSVATTYSAKFSECYAGNSNCAPAGYTPPSPPSSSSTGNGGNGSGRGSGSNPPAIPVITIISQPSNQTAVNGSATFSVSASVTQNAALSYQWQKKEAGASSFVNMNAATSSSLSLSGLTNANDNGDVYQVIVSASGGATSVTSSAATLTVNPCPANGWCEEEMTYYVDGATTSLDINGNGTWNDQTYTSGSLKAVITITSEPSNQTASNGSATFSVTATVTNGAILSYQWQKQESGAGSFTNISGATSSSLVLSNLTNADDNGDVYRCLVSATGGANSVMSSDVALTVPSGPQGFSFCAVGSEVWGGFTYSGLTAGQCRAIGVDTCSGSDDNTPCACGHPFSANSCTEYYQTTQVNSLPGVVSPLSQETCPDAMLAAAETKRNQLECENLSTSHPEYNALWIQRSAPGYNVAGTSQVGVNGKYCQVGLHNNYPLYKGNVQYSGYDTYIYVSTATFGYWVIGTRPYPTDEENADIALFVSGSSSGVPSTPPLDAWQQQVGVPPSPTLSVTSCD